MPSLQSCETRVRETEGIEDRSRKSRPNYLAYSGQHSEDPLINSTKLGAFAALNDSENSGPLSGASETLSGIS
ncbi:hypothetical protein KIN20_034857 [Parelaphostrongylus tenuis]|uniref:Uncharacterized protein n=1 Tax=Parelaphostrongylus tenuis TaxID=148309 RepID=A0AAD5RAN8_PARTN|nr:hypothetical protein KIN20_034857 [Parelaphostrongylus tenuis]